MKRLLRAAVFFSRATPASARMIGLALTSITLIVAVSLHIRAQNRMNYSLVSPDSGHVVLGLALRKLGVSGTFMQAPAHPDDETNSLFALFGYGMGLRTIDLQNNRGEGGQNEIGPELFRDIGVLRTLELLAAHRIDGAEQYFTRAIDYGYSFDPQEVIGKWGREDIVGDYVRLIRMLRPDVVVTMNIQGRGGDRAHEATTILVRESWLAAGDPSRYPEQIREGLRPWQPKKLYFSAGFGGPGGRGGADAPGGSAGIDGPGGRGGRGPGPDGPAPASAPARPEPPPVKLAPVNTAAYDPLLGRTYQEIGADARSFHKCQGIGGLPALPGMPGGRGEGGPPGRGPGGRGEPAPGGRGPRAPGAGGRGGGYQLMETSIAQQKNKDETSLFDGIDISLASLSQYAGPNPPQALTAGLAQILSEARRAQSAFAAGNDAATVAPVEAGLVAVRTLRAQLSSMGLSDSVRYEIDFRLHTKERDYEDAVVAAHGLTFDAVADDGLVIAGQPVKLSILAQNHGPSDVAVTQVAIAGFDGGAPCVPATVKKDAVFACAADAHVLKDAKLTSPYFSDNYWKHPSGQAISMFEPDVPFGVPFAPTPFRVTFHVKAGDAEVTREVPVQFRYMKDTYYGDKRMELSVVPAFSVNISPPLSVIPAPIPATGLAAKPIEREVHVSVTNGAKSAAQVRVALQLPEGWSAVPPSVPIDFTREDESLSARFRVTAPHAKTGEYTLRAVVTSTATGDRKFASGYQEIEYPHVQRRQVIKPAETTLKVVDVRIAPDVSVGYIVGVGDQVPPAIEQLGAKLTLIGPDELAWGDLSRYGVIITGVRAYERRADLRAYNRRLLEYAGRGGTVVIQYNKMEFNQAEYGPYSAKVSANRVSDETIPVKVLTPDHPLFNYPNRIGAGTWAGWVQERGLYFLGEKDARYVDLVSMVDSFKDNPGVKLGSLVEGKVGRGRWIYLGLALWRQLPAGTEGAYQLLANLISLGKVPPALPKKTTGAAAR